MPARLRDPRSLTIVPAAVAVAAFGLGYLVWLLVGLDAGTACDAFTCGPGIWSAVITVLWTIAAVAGAVAAAGMLFLAGRSFVRAFTDLRD